LQKIKRNSPWRSAKQSSQLMLIIKTVKMALKQKSLEMFGTGDFKEGTTAFREKQVIYGE
jgi:hypothetical protein